MSRKSTIDSIMVPVSVGSAVSTVNNPGRVRTGAIAGMRSHLSDLNEGARAAKRLQEQISSGAAVIDIDTALIDGSMVVDRIATDIDPSFDNLVDSIKEAGQQVPILVRPTAGGRYQIAYGHRRVRAALKLGIKVKALVRTLTDAELVVAQGKENLDRKDLSFIERAQFARRLEDKGYDRSVIMAALSTEKANLSRYIAVARSIPETLVQAIGPAGKAGRARWLALAEQIKGREDLARAATEKPEFKAMDSDARFCAVLRALTRPAKKATTWVGGKAARIDRKEDRTVLTIHDAAAPEFGAFVAGRMDDLYREYLDRRKAA
jgi:ParB family chromosome partitioning protein